VVDFPSVTEKSPRLALIFRESSTDNENGGYQYSSLAESTQAAMIFSHKKHRRHRDFLFCDFCASCGLQQTVSASLRLCAIIPSGFLQKNELFFPTKMRF
jgi:hypothetical protein